MHWLRVDRYRQGPEDAPRTVLQPVPGAPGEKAPRQMGCPVHARVHGPRGSKEVRRLNRFRR